MEKILVNLKNKKNFWDIFTLKEEYEQKYKDIHGRSIYVFSKNKDILKSKLSEYLLKKNILNIEYPDNKRFVVCLTHDVDIVYISKKTLLKELTKSLINFKSIPNLIKKNRFINFFKIIEIEKKYNAKSTFFFSALNRKDFEFNYKIEDLKNEIKGIIENGFEIALHGGYDTYNDINKIKKEKDRLENITLKEVIGYRNHYLRFKIPDSWELLKNAGFEYDSTLSFPDTIGFKNGLCHPFKPFNLMTNKFIDIFEIPPNIIDYVLFGKMNLNIETAWEIVKIVIDETEKNKGVLTVLWHNTSFNDKVKDFYERILDYCMRKNAWLTSAENIWKFFMRL